MKACGRTRPPIGPGQSSLEMVTAYNQGLSSLDIILLVIMVFMVVESACSIPRISGHGWLEHDQSDVALEFSYYGHHIQKSIWICHWDIRNGISLTAEERC